MFLVTPPHSSSLNPSLLCFTPLLCPLLLLYPSAAAQVVLMRVHASASELFDRQLEIDTFKGVSKAGLGPQLLMLFTNGRVEEFLGQHVSS
jgi:hypothetical protein